MLRSARNFDDLREAQDVVMFDPDKEPSKTVQSQRDEADINVLVHRFGLTGTMPVNMRVPIEGDFDEIFDFQSAQNAIRLAQESFNSMTAEVRAKFQNDPQLFYEYCTEVGTDGKLKNLKEMRDLGIAREEEVVVESPPQRVVVVSESKDGED